jgi:hypothetical protein
LVDTTDVHGAKTMKDGQTRNRKQSAAIMNQKFICERAFAAIEIALIAAARINGFPPYANDGKAG